MIFLQLIILSHVLSDFVFQTNKMVAEKESDLIKVFKRAHLLHSFTVFIISFLLLFFPVSPDVALLYSLITAIIHYFIDTLKYRFFNKSQRFKFISFLLDQFLHIASLVFIWVIFQHKFGVYKLWMSNLICLNFPYLFSAITSNMIINILNTLIVYTFVCWGGAVIIDLTLNLLGINNAQKSISASKRSIIETNTSMRFLPFHLPVKTVTNITVQNADAPPPSDDAFNKETSRLVGKYIGIFERLIIMTLVIKNSYSAIAFVFAAKSLARANDIIKKDEKFAEYYLIGTLLSTSIAILGGILLCYMLGYT